MHRQYHVLASARVHRFAGFAVAAAGVLAAWPARADDRSELFGLQKPPAAAPLDCGDGKAFACALATDPVADAPEPYALSTWLSGAYLMSLPTGNATHDQVAGYALGAGTDGVGVVLGGATGAENRWTIDGAPIDNIATGTADTKIPLAFLDGMLVTAGGFGARDRTSTGGTIDAQLRKGGETHVLDAYAWIGQTAPVATSPTPNDTYSIRTLSVSRGPTATAAVVATGPLGHLFGGTAWYAAGIAPELSLDSFDWTTQRLVDKNHDGIPDGSPGQLVTQSFDSYSRGATPFTVPAMLRAGWDRGAHHLDITAIGQDVHTERALDNATLESAGVDVTDLTADGIATYHGTWTDTHVKLQIAWHHAAHRESATDPAAANIPQVLDAYVPAGFSDTALAAGCMVGQTASFTPCPVPTSWLFSGGAGLLTQQTADRPTVTADITHRIGANTIRAGVTDEDTRLATTEHFTGDEQILSVFAGQMSTLHFVDSTTDCPPDPAQHCTYLPSATVTYHTRYTAGYAEDTFELAPGLVANGGLRWEMDQVGDVLVFHDEPAPRLGVAWDPIGGGRSRVWASMGRSYALLVAGMGTTLLGTAPTENDESSSFGLGRTLDPGSAYPVAHGIEPMYQDELTSGVEATYPGVGRATAWVQARYLRQGFDTMYGRFDNPGRIDDFVPEASRDTQVWAFEVATAPTAPVALRAGYTYTQVFGTWTGAYDPNQGLVLFSGADYDADPRNLFGRLPTDLAHRVYLEAARRGHLGGLEVGVSTRLTVASGIPRDVLADSDEGLIELLPRGSDGRLPMTSQANLRLLARWHGTEVTLDLFNVFDHRDPTTVDEVYAGNEQEIRPISGGTAEDLIWLRTQDGQIPVREPSFRLPTAFQSPFVAMLGARRSF